MIEHNLILSENTFETPLIPAHILWNPIDMLPIILKNFMIILFQEKVQLLPKHITQLGSPREEIQERSKEAMLM